MSPHRRPRSLPRLLFTICLLSLSAGQPARAEGPPPNDDFANATVIDALPFEAEGDLADATLEPNEPTDCEGSERTIWFRFNPTADADVVASLSGLYGPVLAVFAVQADGSLDLLSCGEYDHGSSIFPFAARSGASYLFSIGTYRTEDIPYRFSLGNDDLGRVEGTITAEGLPLTDGCVDAELIQEEPDQETFVGRAADAGPDGRFHLGALPTGDYRISFSECVWPRTYLTEWYDDRPSQDLAAAVHVEAGEALQGIDADLARGGVVSGRVTDEAEQPLEGICINDGSARTDADGRYRLTGLPTGTVKVGFAGDECFSSGRYFGEWWDDKTDEDSADPVPVVAGQETIGIDARLRLGGWIAGQVTDDEGNPIPNVCVSIPQGQYGSLARDTTDEDGRYLLSPLETGEYPVQITNCGSGDWLGEWYEDAADRDAATAVPVTVGQGTEGIDVVLMEGGSISGRILDHLGQPIFGACANGYRILDGPITRFEDHSTTGFDGIFRLHALPPGDYLIRFDKCTSGVAYAPEWYDDAADQSSADPVHVDAGQDLNGVDAALAPGSVRILQTGDSTTVSEGGSGDTYWLTIDSMPTKPVTVAVDAGSQLTVSPSTVTFAGNSCCASYKITIQAVDDRVAEDAHLATIEHRITTDDPSYATIPPPSLSVSIDDNDNLGIRLVETEGSTRVTEAGSGDSYSVALESQPTGVVTVAAEPDAQVVVAPSTISFTPADWQTPQVVNVTAADDSVNEGPHQGQISHRVSSVDPMYDELTLASVTATIADNDGTPTTLTNLGPASAFTGDPITLSAKLAGPGEAPVPAKSLTFTLKKGGTIYRTASAQTDAEGRASVTLSPSNLPLGSYSVETTFTGDVLTLPSADSDPFAILKRPTLLSLTAPASVYVGAGIPVSATLRDQPTGNPLAGKQVTFALLRNGSQVTSVNALTGANGTSSATLPAAQAGEYTIQVSYVGDATRDGSASSTTVSVLRRAASASLTSAGGEYGESASLTGRLTDQASGAGLEGRWVTFSVLDGEAVLTSGQGYVGSNGNTFANVTLDMPTGEYTAEIRFAGDAIYEPAVARGPMHVWPASLNVTDYQGPTQGTRGQTVGMRARLISLSSERPIEGEELIFSLGATVRTAITDGDGWAQVQMPLEQEPGQQYVAITMEETPNYITNGGWQPFEVRWEHTFTSQNDQGTVHVNPTTKEFQFWLSPFTKSAIKLDPLMQVQTLPNGHRGATIRYSDATLTLAGVFDLDEGKFAAVVNMNSNTYLPVRIL